MDDLISRQAAIDMCRKPRMRNADCSDFEMEIMMLPPAEPELIECDPVKACNKVTMNKVFSAYRYLNMLEDLKMYGYVLAYLPKNAEAEGSEE